MNKFALKLSMLAATIALASCGSDGTEEAPAPAPAPALVFTTFQAADVAIGQDSLTGHDITGVSPYLAYPYGAPAFDSNGKLYAPSDESIYIYGSLPTASGAIPSLVLTPAPSPTATGLALQTILFDTASGKLLALDYSGARILVWNTPPTDNTTPPSYVIGEGTPWEANCLDQIDGENPTATNLDNPEDIQIINGNLVVADKSHNRVLIFNGIPGANDSPTKVLGQPDLSTCNAGAVVSGSQLERPTSVASDGTKLLVADYSNNRLLIWNDFSTLVSGQTADAVLGQLDMASNDPGILSTFDSPYYAAISSSGALAVADEDNHRVLIWTSIPVCTTPSTGCSADFGSPVILGQTDGTKNDANGSVDGVTNAKGLNLPNSVKFNGLNQLMVGDAYNYRFLVFNAK